MEPMEREQHTSRGLEDQRGAGGSHKGKPDFHNK